MAALESLGLRSLSEDRLDGLEGLLVDDALMTPDMDLPPKRHPSHVHGIAQDPDHVRPGERNSVLAAVPLRIEDLSNRLGTHPFLLVHAEDAPDDVGTGGVGVDLLPLPVSDVTERRGADDPATLGGRTFHSRCDPLDDRGPLELGEHREHLQHHLAGGGGGVEGLRCRTERDARTIEVLSDIGELTDVSREPIDSVDEQQLVDPGARL
ncbi:MAG TPA: hypothetical protein VEM93_03645 [Actinomycetota bacterium]|nr:hypothetical protein [Actinomycetota bacterium]